MSTIKTNDVTSKSAGAIAGTGEKIDETTELKAQLKTAQATKKDLNVQLKNTDREIKSLQKRLNGSKKKSKTSGGAKTAASTKNKKANNKKKK